MQSTLRILGFLGTGSFVAHGPFFLGGGTNDPKLIQSIAGTYQWLGEQPVSEPGTFLLKESYQTGLEHLKKKWGFRDRQSANQALSPTHHSASSRFLGLFCSIRLIPYAVKPMKKTVEIGIFFFFIHILVSSD